MNPTKRILALVSFALLPFVASAQPTTEFTAMLSGSQEVPPNASPGSGWASVVYNPTAHTLWVDVSFEDLTAAAFGAHIHAPAPMGASAGIAIGFPGFPASTSGMYTNTFDLTLSSVYNATFLANHGGTAATAEDALAGYLHDGLAYVNIHTPTYPPGEIRGQLMSVPDSGSTALLLLPAALCLVGIARRRQS